MSNPLVLIRSRHCLTTRRTSLLLSTCSYNASTTIPILLKAAHTERQMSGRLRAMLLRPQLQFNATSNKMSSSLLTVVSAAGGGAAGSSLPPLDLTEDNVTQVLADARGEFGQIFDTSVGMTGQAELADLDGPFVKIRLKGRFWHKRSTVLARLGNYLKQRIPEILEVEIEDEKQLDDSPANF